MMIKKVSKKVYNFLVSGINILIRWFNIDLRNFNKRLIPEVEKFQEEEKNPN
jgi:hypothetical protein